MLILSLKPGHDGSICAIDDGKLMFSLEAEKDSFPRYDRITPELLVTAASHLDKVPDVVAVGGWVKGWHSVERGSGSGYFGRGAASITVENQNFMGKSVDIFSSTHERSHIMGAYGMSPFIVWYGKVISVTSTRSMKTSKCIISVMFSPTPEINIHRCS
jgi:predicted NodU family carbamoyl transferase